MIRKYIQNIISESIEDIESKRETTLVNMIKQSLGEKLLKNKLHQEKFLFAIKTLTSFKYDTENLILQIYTHLKLIEQETLKENLTQDILDHSDFLQWHAKNYYQSWQQKSPAEMAMKIQKQRRGMPAPSDMPESTVRHYGMLYWDEWQAESEQLIPEAQDTINNKLHQLKTQYGEHVP